MSTLTSRRTRLVRGFLAALALGPVGLTVLGAQAERAKPVFADGQAQIVPAFQDQAQWIRQTLWVETEFDSDGDGKRDRVFTDVTRPRQTETEGLKVPVIYESSPYFAGTSGPRQFLWDVRQEVGSTPAPRTSAAAGSWTSCWARRSTRPGRGLARDRESVMLQPEGER